MNFYWLGEFQDAGIWKTSVTLDSVILSTEIFPIPAITKSYGEVPLYMTDTLVVAQA